MISGGVQKVVTCKFPDGTNFFAVFNDGDCIAICEHEESVKKIMESVKNG